MTAQSEQACKELNAAIKLDSYPARAEAVDRIIARFGLRNIEPDTYATADGGRIRHNRITVRVAGQAPYEVTN